jgi:tRNA dimethylallyltransferase
VCGGTGLYVKALCEGLDEMPETDGQVVARIENDYRSNGIEWLQQTVRAEDPEFYRLGEIQNPARMVRALSFVRCTGRSILDYRTGEPRQRSFQTIKVGLELPREELYDRINHRVDVMMSQGLLDEAQGLYPQRHLKNLQTVGYTELFEYLGHKCSLAEAIDKIKQHTRNYAKRQLTWFKKDRDIKWFQADDADVVEKILAVEE